MKVLLSLIAAVVVVALVAVLLQEWRYLRIRRDLAGDQQSLFHSSSVFHVVSLLKLAPGQELLDGVRDYVNSVEKNGAQVVYAGKTVINGRTSSQLPPDDWEAFIVTQYPSREAWDKASTSAEYRDLKARFANVYSLGMQRNAALNLALPAFLLGQRVSDFVRRTPPRYPFETSPFLSLAPPEARAQLKVFDDAIQANLEYGRKGMVIVNFAKGGTSEQRKANDGYGNEMFNLFAEVGGGPTHMGKAVTLEGDADFDQVIIVYYPGVEFFGEMIRSTFYTGIFGGKQLGDDLSSLTVPILPHL